jgi:pilus assembly protein CpaB
MALRLTLFVLLSAALIAVAVFGISLVEQSNRPAPVAAVPTTSVLVAAGPLHAGSLLQPGDIGAARVAANEVPAGASPDTPANRSSLIGAMVRQPLAAGALLVNTAVIRPGDHGFLAAVLAPGMRAITVGVDAVSGAAGLIWPGDRVDVLLTETVTGSNIPVGHQISAELVLTDVRVIATGQQIVQGAQGAQTDARPTSTTVTLEVTPEEAERVAVANRLGPLSLVVHSSQTAAGAHPAAPPQTPPVWADQVSPNLAPSQDNSSVVSTVRVFQGNGNGQDYKF